MSKESHCLLLHPHFDKVKVQNWCLGKYMLPKKKKVHKSFRQKKGDSHTLLCSSQTTSNGKESACNAGDPGLSHGWGRSPGEGNGYPLQYSCLEDSMDKGAWQAISPWGCRGQDTSEWLTLSQPPDYCAKFWTSPKDRKTEREGEGKWYERELSSPSGQ